MNSRLEELQATHKAEYAALQKKYETLKVRTRILSTDFGISWLVVCNKVYRNV